MKRLISRLALLLVPVALLLFLLSAFRPAGSSDNNLPVIKVQTVSVKNITTTGAECYFSVTDPDKIPKTIGVCVGKGVNPTLSNTKFGMAKGSIGPVNFRSTISGLAAASTYHVRAYVTTSTGTIYGNDLAFTTAKPVKGK